MRLRDSFLHNVIVHPLLFVSDLLLRLGVGQDVAAALDTLHDLTAPTEGPDPGPLEDIEEPEGEEPEDETAGWPVPAQDPSTPASRALEWRPTPAPREERAAPVLEGSAVARMRATHRTG